MVQLIVAIILFQSRASGALNLRFQDADARDELLLRNEDKELIMRLFIIFHIFGIGLYIIPICCTGSMEGLNKILHPFYHCLFLFGMAQFIANVSLICFFAAICIPQIGLVSMGTLYESDEVSFKNSVIRLLAAEGVMTLLTGLQVIHYCKTYETILYPRREQTYLEAERVVPDIVDEESVNAYL